MNMKTYHFPSLNESEETGFNDPLINNFREPIYNLTRESIQNILDAKDPAVDGPVIAQFELHKISPGSLPDSARLKEIIAACWRHEKDDKSEGEEFFKNAFNLINNNKSIEILKISDYNTTGLYGDDTDRTGAYYKLMKIQGSSNKTRGMGGSFGLGKGAYFRPSLFRTIFVSSIWGDNKPVFQGKLRFVSHFDDSEMKHAIGYYAFPAIRSKNDIPEFFRRDEKGTSIFILGFEDSQNWQKQMTEAVLRHFWLAILENKLEVKIGNSIISKDSLEEKIFNTFSEVSNLDNYNPIPFLKTYKEGQVIKKHLQVLGPVELRILLGNNLPSRVEYFRNTGMVIQNKPLNSSKGFAGIFTCIDENEILRRMEDPEHKIWSKENPTTSNPEEKKKFAQAEKELREFIRSTLNELTASIETTESTIQDLDRYFYSPADENDSGNGSPDSIEGEIVGQETGSIVRGGNSLRKKTKITIQVKVPIELQGKPNGEGSGGGEGTGEGGGSGTGHPDDQGNQLIKINKNINFRRSYVKVSDSRMEHVVLIAGAPQDKFDMDVRIGTEDSFDKIPILQAVDGEGKTYGIDENNIRNIIIPENGEMTMGITFKLPGKYSLNIRAYESK